MAYQDKLKPINTATPTSTPSYRDKLKPINDAPAASPFVQKSKPRTATEIATDFGAGIVHGLGSIGRGIQDALPRAISTVPDFGKKTAGKKGNEMPASERSDKFSYKAGNLLGEIAPYVVQPSSAAVKGVPFLAKAGKVAVDAARNTAIGTAQTGDVKEGAMIGVGGEVLGALTKPLAATGKAIYKSVIPLSKKEAGIVQSYKAEEPFLKRVAMAIAGDNSKLPITNAETAFRKGLWGTQSGIGIQAKRGASDIWKKTVAPALKGAKEQIDIPKFFEEAKEKIIKSNPELSRQKSLLEALEALKDDYKGVPTASLEQFQKFKEGWAQFVPDKAYKGQPIAGAFNDVRNTISGIARNKIYETVANPIVKKAYIDYGNMKGLQEWGKSAMTGEKLKGGAGSFISALKDAALIPVATTGGKILYKTAQGIEFIAPAGAKTLHDIFSSFED